jgi:hypothetical protein
LSFVIGKILPGCLDFALYLSGRMGQGTSSNNGIPETVESIQEGICRHARVFSEIAGLTYEDFQSCLAKLNTL